MLSWVEHERSFIILGPGNRGSGRVGAQCLVSNYARAGLMTACN